MIADLEDRAVDAVFGGDELFVLSRKDAPNGRILRVELGARRRWPTDGDRR